MMEALLKGQKITLQVNGREMTFSKEELVAILEKHFNTEPIQQKEKGAQTIKESRLAETEVARTPIEGKWFKVNPTEIDQGLFSQEKSDRRQERDRQLILEAFAEMKNNPQYAKPFKTLRPKKTWCAKNVSELEKIACNLGDHMANWVEQALEWAQRISNGETWEEVCNNPDTADWYRLIVWKNGYARVVGDSRAYNYNHSATDVSDCDCNFDYKICSAVPLVVL